jgi:hypothetical protein
MLLHEELALRDASEQREVLVVLTETAIPAVLATKLIRDMWR